MEKKAFYQHLVAKGYGERTLQNEPMSRHTTFGIGGSADLLVIANTIAELQELVALAQQCSLPAIIIGEGSNILVADAGIRGLVIVNRCNTLEMQANGLLVVESGALLRQVARWAVEQGWEGLEWASGVPGTVGGAVVGNAGAYSGCIADNLIWSDLLQHDNHIERISNAALEFGYRSSVIKRSAANSRPLVLRAGFSLKAGDPDALACRMLSFTKQRNERTPSGRSAGSVFKRTLQYPAGFLIEQCGLKGYQIGGAQVSPVHANFIINVEQATATEVAALVELVQRRVWEAHSQALELEIEYVGAWEKDPGEAVNTRKGDR
ncbi:MAG: UDP-N-acetylmuramate dehydrogenase [Anaerolineae bacterium]